MYTLSSLAQLLQLYGVCIIPESCEFFEDSGGLVKEYSRCWIP